MQTTSQTWKDIVAGGNPLIETRATIAGTVYTDIGAPVVTRAAMQEGLSVGNVVSACCLMSMRTTDTIPKSAEVLLEVRVTDNENTSEWKPAGTFYISRRSRDPLTGIITLECYDALLKANSVLDAVPWTTGSGEVVTTGNGEWIYVSSAYPRAMDGILADIALVLGVEIDPRTQIETGFDVTGTVGVTTIRDVLSQIAAANGGNWIISPDNKLRLVPVIDAADAEEATEDVVDVYAIIGGIYVGDAAEISGVRYTYGDALPVLLGDDTGIIIDVALPEEQATHVAELLIGTTYKPFALTTAIYDPATEIGDYIRSGEELSGVLYNETVTLGSGMRSDASAPDPAELADEYPYLGASAKALSEAKAYAAEVVENAIGELDESLDQQSVFARLTNNGETQGVYMQDGKIYINGTYIQAGTIVANLIKGGTLTLGGADNENGLLQVLNANGDVVVTLDDSGASINKGEIELRQSNALGLNIGPYGDLAIGEKPEDLSSMDGNKCAFQVNNWGGMKLEQLNFYSRNSSDIYQKRVYAYVEAVTKALLFRDGATDDEILYIGAIGITAKKPASFDESATFNESTTFNDDATFNYGVTFNGDVDWNNSALTPVTSSATGVDAVIGGYVKFGRMVVFTIQIQPKSSLTAAELTDIVTGFEPPVRIVNFEVNSNSTNDGNFMRRAVLDTSGNLSLIGAFDTGDYYNISGSYISAS